MASASYTVLCQPSGAELCGTRTSDAVLHRATRDFGEPRGAAPEPCGAAVSCAELPRNYAELRRATRDYSEPRGAAELRGTTASRAVLRRTTRWSTELQRATPSYRQPRGACAGRAVLCRAPTGAREYGESRGATASHAQLRRHHAHLRCGDAGLRPTRAHLLVSERWIQRRTTEGGPRVRRASAASTRRMTRSRWLVRRGAGPAMAGGWYRMGRTRARAEPPIR